MVARVTELQIPCSASLNQCSVWPQARKPCQKSSGQSSATKDLLEPRPTGEKEASSAAFESRFGLPGAGDHASTAPCGDANALVHGGVIATKDALDACAGLPDGGQDFFRCKLRWPHSGASSSSGFQALNSCQCFSGKISASNERRLSERIDGIAGNDDDELDERGGVATASNLDVCTRLESSPTTSSPKLVLVFPKDTPQRQRFALESEGEDGDAPPPGQEPTDLGGGPPMLGDDLLGIAGNILLDFDGSEILGNGTDPAMESPCVCCPALLDAWTGEFAGDPLTMAAQSEAVIGLPSIVVRRLLRMAASSSAVFPQIRRYIRLTALPPLRTLSATSELQESTPATASCKSCLLLHVS